MGGPGHVPVPASRRAVRGVLDRHAPAHRVGLAARGPRVQLHPHRRHRALQAHAGVRGLLPDGLGRQRPADRAAGAELLRRALRSDDPLRRRLRASRQAGPEEAGADQPAQLHRALQRARGGGREGLRAAVAHARPERRLDPDLHDDRRLRADHEPARVPAQRGPRRGVHAGRSHVVGRDVPDRGGAGRARGPRLPRRLPPGGLPPERRQHDPRRDHASGAHPGRRRADRAPRGRAVPAPVRHHGDLADLRGRGAGDRQHPRRPGEGFGHRALLHVRRPDRCAVVARAPAPQPHRDRPRRPLPARGARVDRERRRARAVHRAGRQDHVLGPRGHRGGAAGQWRPRRRPRAHPAHGQLLREGRQAPRDRVDPAVVHRQRRTRRRPAQRPGQARRRDQLEARLHAEPPDQLDRGAQRRLAREPAALLRHPVPGLVPARRRPPARLRRPDLRRRGHPPGRPCVTDAAGLRRLAARCGRWLHGRSRRARHVGHLVADPAARHGVGA